MLKLVLKYVKKYWYLAILAPLFMILEVTMDMLINQYMATIIDTINGIGGIGNNEIVSSIVTNGVIMLAILLVGVICGILSGVFTNLTAFKATNDLRKDLFAKILSLSYNQIDNYSTGSLVIRVTNDITQIQAMINMSLRMTIRALSMFVLGIVFTLSINSSFAIILGIVLSLEIVCMIIFSAKAFPYFKIMQKKIDRVNTVVHENVTGARVVKAFSKEEYEKDRFAIANNDHADLMLKVSKIVAFIMPILMLLIFAARTLTYYIGGNSVIAFFEGAITNYNDSISIGQITQASTYMIMICMSLMMLGMQFAFIARATASSARIKEILDSEAEIIDGNEDISTLQEQGTIEFKDVSFAYASSEGHSRSGKILENISFKVNKGDTIAIVGSTGSGKSTIVSLINRFYDLQEGEILLDGRNIKEYKMYDLREKIGYCLQTSEMFAGTIGSNIRMGKLDATDEEVLEAARISQALEFINSKPDGLNERVEEKGTSLSGGQKQRIAIARAIIKKPEILIFDDSTSALDLVTESKLFKAMRESISDTTKIVVAQRIATAKHADKIIVLDKGKLVAFDTHENLMKNCEVYIDIYNSQLGEGSVYDD